MQKTKCLFLLLSTCMSVPMAFADDLPFGVARFQWSHQNEADVDAGGSLQYDRWMMQTAFCKPQHLFSGLHLIPTMRYTMTHVDLSGTGLDELSDLHQLELPMTYFRKYEGTAWTLNGNVTPGFASDFQDVDGDDFYVEARIGGDYQFTDTFSLNFGIAYTRVTGDPGVIPFIGFDWKPNDEWRASIFGPRIDVRYSFSDDFLMRLSGAPSGGLWNFQEETTNQSRFLNLVSYHVGITLEKELCENVWLYAGGGISVLNHIETRDTDSNTLYEQDADQSTFWHLGLRVGNW